MVPLGRAALLLLTAASFLRAQTPPATPVLPKLRVLILTGVSGHKWRETTPLLRDFLERSGRFDVRVNEEVRGNGPETFAAYDVLLLNYSDQRKPELWWDERARQAMLDFVRSGKGLVCYHASNGAFNGWPEFDKLVGGTWRATGGHAPYHAYTVRIVDPRDPIAKGLPPSFAATDELYHGLSLQPNIHVLATAFDDPKNCAADGKNCGTGKDEPLIWTLAYGEGRVFQTALGHDAKAMQSDGFMITLQRGTEWAATGQVTIPPSPATP
jgi:type 1 glutamine amidotransferase